ncbi:hypothetical protein CJU89_6950 [Yarrowia sp. B02]|nr:hypothetical protein CJU89_6950 [Yarrowia sp. B02]
MYTPYGTPVKDKKHKIGQRDDFAYDKHGLRRFHGAFEGGWSAGYYNTVGSKEGWTPRQWNSNKDGKATNTVEDYMDDEDERHDSHPEIINVGPEILARWCTSKKNAFEVFPEAPKTYQGLAGIGYEARLVDSSEPAAQKGPKRLTMSTNTISSIEPGSGKKRPLLLEDEEDEELYPVTKALPKLRKESSESGKSKSLVVKHKFLSAKERKVVSESSKTPKARAKVNLAASPTCSDGKLPLSGFIVIHVSNDVFKKYGLASTPVAEVTLQNTVQQQVDSFLDSLDLPAAQNPYKSKLDSKFQLAGSAVEGPKQDSARTVVEEWVPSKLLCKRMGVRYEKMRPEDEVVQHKAKAVVNVDKLRKLFE